MTAACGKTTADVQNGGETVPELTYMDCWNFVAPLIPVTDDLTMEIYVMVFNALKKAEEQRKESKGK